MGFESGSVSFRWLHLARALPEDALKRLAREALPPLEDLGSAPVHGWVSGRHLLDREIDADTAYYGGHLRLALVAAERKIPTALLRAQCRMEELAVQRAEGQNFLSQKARAEIRRSVENRLRPQMPPQLKGVALVQPTGTPWWYVGALSVRQLEAWQAAVNQTLKLMPVALTPAALAALLRKTDARDLAPCSFASDIPPDQAAQGLGLDFLTWLLFCADARGGQLHLERLGTIAFMLEGPLTFVSDGAGAHEAVLRKGDPLRAAETRTALRGGKKLSRARLTLMRGDEQWQVALDAVEFVFRGLRLPETEANEPVGRFQERIVFLETFRELFFGLYERFLEERGRPQAWNKTLKEVAAWIQ